MAKQIIWSLRAQKDKRDILFYWANRNKSNSYSKKLNHLFNSAIRLIRQHPFIGRPTEDKFVSIKIVQVYLIIYEVSETSINILSIWDGRQDPAKLEEILK